MVVNCRLALLMPEADIEWSVLRGVVPGCEALMLALLHCAHFTACGPRYEKIWAPFDVDSLCYVNELTDPARARC